MSGAETSCEMLLALRSVFLSLSFLADPFTP